MQTLKQISIPNPCSQNWQEMTPSRNGRHCGQCSTTIVDFTKMTNQQIIDILSAPNHICARVGIEQLGMINRQLHCDNITAVNWWKRVLIAASITVSAQHVEAQTPVINPVDLEQLQTVTIGQVIRKADTTHQITGIIIDKKDKSPLPGVSITVKGTGGSTVTNADGFFSVSVPTPTAQLSISCIGYIHQEIVIPVSTRPVRITLQLKEKTGLIGEVVVVIRAPFFKRIYYRFIKRPIKKVFG